MNVNVNGGETKYWYTVPLVIELMECTISRKPNIILKAISGAIFTCLNNQLSTDNNPDLLFITACMMPYWMLPGYIQYIEIIHGKVYKPLPVHNNIYHLFTVGAYPAEPDEKCFTGM